MLPGKERENLNYGGKIVMPPSALNKLTMLHIRYPMLFEITSEETQLKTHAGVLEFIAEEGRVYLPQWMMETLALSPGSLIRVANVDLPSGAFVKIEPQSTDFLDITDPRAVLENALRNFSTLTVDDIFQISYNDKIYSIKVLEAKPESESKSVCVVETDLEVDFAPPVGYVEPTPTPRSGTSYTPSRASQTPVGGMAANIGYDNMVAAVSANKRASAFSGTGQKLSGKSVVKKPSEADDVRPSDVDLMKSSDAPALVLPFGQLFFGYPVTPLQDTAAEEERERSETTGKSPHFQGQGKTLRESRKRKQASSELMETSPKQRTSSPEVIEID
jgi:ubiquitin fusion degradation protein 1